MNEQEWTAAVWEQRGDTYHYRDGDYEYRVCESEDCPGEWQQWERYVGDPEWPWVVNGVADTLEAAKRIF